MQKPKKPAFRPDINALRACAVLSVVFFHFQVPGFNGGFVGVDVFFVISGFLMTQIIYGQLLQKKFSLAAFYEARIRRIMPALITLAVVLLGLGYFYMIPYDYTILGKRVLTSLTFVSNIAMLHKAPYFDPASREQWLLHTWSLSVEGQFYLFWPFFLMALHKNGKYVRPCILGVFFLSLCWCILRTHEESSAAFYSLPTRVWEFTAGGLVYFFRTEKLPPKGIALLGFALILTGIFFYSGNLEYPGYFAILPVAGAALLILGRPAGVLVTNRPVQFFGDISYSLYLWHWPVIVGAKYLGIDLTPVHLVELVSLSAALAYLSYEYIEKPTHYGLDWKICLGLGAPVVLAAYLTFAFGGLPYRVPQNVLEADRSIKDINPRRAECMYSGRSRDLPTCHVGTSAPPSAAVWGDSHADALFSVADKALTEDKRSAYFYSYGGCMPVLGISNDSSCRYFNAHVVADILSHPEIKDVIIVGRWSSYKGGLDDDRMAQPNTSLNEKDYAGKMVQTMCMLANHKKNVYAVAPIPEMDRPVAAAIAKSRLLWNKDIAIEITLKDYAERHDTVLKALATAQQQCHVHVLDPKPYLCNETACSGLKDGKPLYRDDNHLSNTGSFVLEPLFAKAFAGKI